MKNTTINGVLVYGAVLLGKTLLVKLLGMKQPGVSKMKKLKNFLKDSGLVAVLVVAPHSMASELTVPNQFSSGDVTSANDMNANFAAIEAAVNDNHALISSSLDIARSQFVGFSSDTVNGGAGIFVMQQACESFSPKSHICDSSEVAHSTFNIEAVNSLSGSAWVLVDNDSSGDGGVSSFGLITRPANWDNLSCAGWGSSSAGATGMAVSSNGQFTSTTTCNSVLAVACCK
jgi:hypothetical protein